MQCCISPVFGRKHQSITSEATFDSTAQCSIVQHRTVQHRTVQHNTVQHMNTENNDLLKEVEQAELGIQFK